MQLLELIRATASSAAVPLGGTPTARAGTAKVSATAIGRNSSDSYNLICTIFIEGSHIRQPFGMNLSSSETQHVENAQRLHFRLDLELACSRKDHLP